jgi:rod shape-determining protein MreC
VSFPRRARDLLIVAALLGLSLFLLQRSTHGPGGSSGTHDLSFVERGLLRLSAPLQHGATSAGDALGRVWSRYIYLVDVKKDNERLAADNARLRSELERAKLELVRGQRLERLLGLRQEVPSETAAARVIGVESSPFFRVVRVRLDRGSDEMKPGMPVLVPEGVVGRVGRVFGRYSDVVLAVDPKSSIDVVLPRTGGRGVLKGVSGENGYRARIEYLLRSEEVKEGDEVVTSGVGGVFPRGVAVGKIAKVVRRDFGLYQEAEVTPSVDFSRLDEVLVVLAPPPPPDPDAGGKEKKPSEPHRGLGVPR